MERTLHNETREALSKAGLHLAAGHPPGLEDNLQLQIYSKALEQFIPGFPTYAPLLRKIKHEMESTLDDSVACALDCVGLRTRLHAAKATREAAVEHAYAQVFSCITFCASCLV
jgi:hypothetical protein